MADGAHYKPYSEVLNTDTNDDNRPSVINSTKRVTEEEQVYIIVYIYSKTCLQGTSQYHRETPNKNIFKTGLMSIVLFCQIYFELGKSKDHINL